MLQRITLVFVTLLCLCSVVATALVWQAVRQGQQATAALVAEVKALRGEAKDPEDDRMKYLDWIPVTVRLEYENGQPVSGPEFHVTLYGTKLLGENSQSDQLEGHPDAGGLVDFGFVKPRELTLSVSTPWHDSLRRSLTTRPGQPLKLTITCPRQPATSNVVKAANLKLNWPAEFREQDLWTYLVLRPADRELKGNDWQTAVTETWTLLVSPEGTIYRVSLSEADAENPTGWEWSLIRNALWNDTSHDTGPPELAEEELDRFSSQMHHATLDGPVTGFDFPETGAAVTFLCIVQRKTSPSATTFQPFAPVDFDRESFGQDHASSPANGSNNWTYQPSDDVVELIRKRLRQFKGEEKPDNEEFKVHGGVI